MKKIFLIATIIILSFSFSIPVLAKSDTCGKNGCTRENTANGTVYCNYHAAQYVREQGYTACSCSDCYRRREKGSSYCSVHTCDSKDCYKKATSENEKYCDSHTPKKVEEKTTYKKSTTSKKTNSSKKSIKSSAWKSYDEGYEDVYDNDDYDWDRYWSDSEYADGVDDAMEDMDW